MPAGRACKAPMLPLFSGLGASCGPQTNLAVMKTLCQGSLSLILVLFITPFLQKHTLALVSVKLYVFLFLALYAFLSSLCPSPQTEKFWPAQHSVLCRSLVLRSPHSDSFQYYLLHTVLHLHLLTSKISRSLPGDLITLSLA